MSDQKIVCPHCRGEFPLTDALDRRIREAATAELEARLRRETEKIRAEARDGARRELELELDDLARTMKDQVARNDELKKRLREAQDQERALRRDKEELTAAREALELDVARRLDEERARLRADARRQALDESTLALREKEKLVADLRAQMDDMKRRMEQGSQQAQGEILEVELEKLLREAFPLDRIEPVPKGMRGADVVQEVMSAVGQSCGKILWESKRTKQWGGDWVAKLAEDRLRAKADVAALVSTVLPKEVRHFGCVDGVWVCDFPTALGVATSLRAGLVELRAARSAEEGRSGKMERLYAYLMGPEFRARIEGMMAVYREMRKELDQEQAAITRMWARREKQIQQFVEHTARMCGDMQGIGAGLADIPGLGLPGGEQLPLLDTGDE
jgi:hypothetical protein